jgi:hypothetical protein
MPKRRADDDDEWNNDPEVAHHLGHFAQGSITELRTKDPRDKTFEKRSHYDGSGKIGFDLSPRKKRRCRTR